MTANFKNLSCDRIVNLTSQEIELHDELGTLIVLMPPAVTPITIPAVTSSYGRITSPHLTLILTRKTLGRCNNLPDPVEGTIFIVDEMVARLHPEREDFYVMGMPSLCSGNINSISVLTPI